VWWNFSDQVGWEALSLFGRGATWLFLNPITFQLLGTQNFLWNNSNCRGSLSIFVFFDAVCATDRGSGGG